MILDNEADSTDILLEGNRQPELLYKYLSTYSKEGMEQGYNSCHLYFITLKYYDTCYKILVDESQFAVNL